MKTRKWIVSALIVTSLMTFTSCLNGGGGNTQSFDAVPAYITTDGAYVVMHNLAYYSPLYVSGLTSYLDSYGFASYSIDFDNQVESSNYFAATVLNFVPINTTREIQMRSGDMASDRANDSILNAVLYSSSLLNDYCFMAMKQDAPNGNRYVYELVYNTDSTAKYECPRIYMKATVDAGSGSIQEYFYNAFNMRTLMFSSYAKDTTDTYYNVNYRLCRFDLYYQTGKDSEGRPVFKASENNPQVIIQRKD